MQEKKGLFKSSVSRKNMMAISGLFISFFLVIHLIGNLILIIPESFFPIEFWGNVANVHDMYNAYSHFLVHFWPVSFIAWILYAFIIIHIVDAIMITYQNNKSRGDKYVITDRTSSKWYARNMGILGTILAGFIVIHMAQFWLKYKVLGVEEDLYNLVVATFKVGWFVLLYVISIIAMGFHLIHGIESAHTSLGLHQKKAVKFIKKFALWFSVALTILYAIIPIIIYFKDI
jgi:succinate dehydrogenase / fumarate reductase cytochrome b subunit